MKGSEAFLNEEKTGGIRTKEKASGKRRGSRRTFYTKEGGGEVDR